MPADPERVKDFIRLADSIAQKAFDGLRGQAGERVWWRPGDPEDEDARETFRRLVMYMDAKDDLLRQLEDGHGV